MTTKTPTTGRSSRSRPMPCTARRAPTPLPTRPPLAAPRLLRQIAQWRAATLGAGVLASALLATAVDALLLRRRPLWPLSLAASAVAGRSSGCRASSSTWRRPVRRPLSGCAATSAAPWSARAGKRRPRRCGRRRGNWTRAAAPAWRWPVAACARRARALCRARLRPRRAAGRVRGAPLVGRGPPPPRGAARRPRLPRRRRVRLARALRRARVLGAGGGRGAGRAGAARAARGRVGALPAVGDADEQFVDGSEPPRRRRRRRSGGRRAGPLRQRRSGVGADYAAAAAEPTMLGSSPW